MVGVIRLVVFLEWSSRCRWRSAGRSPDRKDGEASVRTYPIIRPSIRTWKPRGVLDRKLIRPLCRHWSMHRRGRNQ